MKNQLNKLGKGTKNCLSNSKKNNSKNAQEILTVAAIKKIILEMCVFGKFSLFSKFIVNFNKIQHCDNAHSK